MRRPRIEDYDPNLKLPELASPIDGMPGVGKPPQKSNATAEEKLQGGTGSMSAMAREALDDYIAKRKKK
jgi:hypothetical protein